MQKPRSSTSRACRRPIAIEQKHIGPHAPLDRRHGDRDLRLPADPHGPAGRAVLPGLRRADRHASRPTRSSARSWTSRRDEALPDGPAGDPGRRAATRRCGRRSARRATCGSASTARRYSIDELPQIDRRRKHAVEVVVDRVTVRPRRPVAASPAAWRTPCRWAAACCTWPIPATTCPSRTGRSRSTASTSPATAAAGASSRSRRTTSRSTARSAGARPARGWARRPAPTRPRCCAIPKLTLAQGAVALWPTVGQPLFAADARGAVAAAPACRSTCRSTSSAPSTAG